MEGIITKKGNLLDAKGIIVHGCNCQGVMGSGVALAVKEKWPSVYDTYKSRERQVGLELGDVHVCYIDDDTVVVNGMTQYSYGRLKIRYVNYDAVEQVFAKVGHRACELRMPVHFPLIGCGLGGGDWGKVSEIINRTLGDIPKTLWVQ